MIHIEATKQTEKETEVRSVFTSRYLLGESSAALTASGGRGYSCERPKVVAE